MIRQNALGAIVLESAYLERLLRCVFTALVTMIRWRGDEVPARGTGCGPGGSSSPGCRAVAGAAAGPLRSSGG